MQSENRKIIDKNSKHFKFFVVAFSLALFAFSFTVARAVVIDPDSNQFSYLFHLYYENGRLLADRDFEFKYDIIGAGYEPPSATTEFPYRGEIINFAGEVARNFIFDPRSGDVHFTKGKVSVKAPYVADGQKAVFYNFQNEALLTVSVSESSYCNDDGICNSDRGEDSLSCPKDCRQTLPAPPITGPGGSGEEAAAKSGIIWGAIILAIGIILGAGLWLWRRRKVSALPTPPPPVGGSANSSTPNNPV